MTKFEEFLLNLPTSVLTALGKRKAICGKTTFTIGSPSKLEYWEMLFITEFYLCQTDACSSL